MITTVMEVGVFHLAFHSSFLHTVIIHIVDTLIAIIVPIVITDHIIMAHGDIMIIIVAIIMAIGMDIIIVDIIGLIIIIEITHMVIDIEHIPEQELTARHQKLFQTEHEQVEII